MSTADAGPAERILDALKIPEACLLGQRVPKKLLLEHGSPTAADKRLIQDVIEEIRWTAALKPNKIGIPEYRDDVREYLEIAVLVVTLRGNDASPGKIARLAERIHRAIPYPVFLLLTEAAPPEVPAANQPLHLSLAHKRWAQNEAGKVVLEGDAALVTLKEGERAAGVREAFLGHLSLASQPPGSLFSVYQGWIDTMIAWQIAEKTGRFVRGVSPDERARQREAFLEDEALAREAKRLQAAAAKERQLARRVELNLALRDIQARRAHLRTHVWATT